MFRKLMTQVRTRVLATIAASLFIAGSAHAIAIPFSFSDGANSVAGTVFDPDDDDTSVIEFVLLDIFDFEGVNQLADPGLRLDTFNVAADNTITLVGGQVTAIDLDVSGSGFRLDFQDLRPGLGNRLFVDGPGGDFTVNDLFVDGSSAVFGQAPAAVPSPAPLALLSVGFIAFGVARYRAR